MRDLSKKENYVKEFKAKIEKAKVIVLSSVEGVTVEQITQLRKNLREVGDEIRVVKNTLLRRAFHDMKMEGLEPFMTGSTAVTFGYSDPVAPVKVMFDFAEKAQKFQFKAGLLGNSMLTVKQLEALSKLPGRKELLSMLLSTMVGPIRNLVSVCQGPIRKLVYAVQAIREKKEKAAA
ncbi:MAG: LSU ribosomal protein L10p (P0) [Candidatus Ozemobacter sibiricus]|uniref:Large ribosomal subunit protein uL10 n=1 Tax=Candidatus Ozemobacter sibiricus TaxID=2268124 RepID=A0A367ZMM2_9BACT|nr:MAG: LSU ribosomal protein L10p (P0) [Candidatus Ozemobacter sibiricus]